MKVVFSDQDTTRAGYVRNLLQSAGIACYIQNENTRTLGPSVFGYSYTQLLDPTVCILDDSQFEEAISIIDAHLGSSPVDLPEWLCPNCKESNPASFELCWNCQATKLPRP